MPSHDCASSPCGTPPARAAGRRATPSAIRAADSAKVTALPSSDQTGPSTATTKPPATKPSSWLSWWVMLLSPLPVMYASPGSTSGMIAARAATNGGENMWAR